MELNAKKLDEIETVTLGHYNQHAEAFWNGTKDHDVSQNYTAFLAPFPKSKMLDILDLGCGAGRGVKYFQSLGHKPVGLDGSKVFCDMARQYTGCKILQQTFLSLDLPSQSFDGIFANAALFHVPSQKLPHVLDDLHSALRPGGILFLSNPRGDDEGWSGQRYGHYMQFEASKQFLEEAGFEVFDHFYRPLGKPKHEQPWLAIVANKLLY
jgi:SAM-dependent methyltransferase